jgi:MFS transporter, FHS family, L-fucose permease
LTTSAAPASRERRLAVTFVAVTSLFFAWGFITSMNDPLIPAVRAIFELNYAESLLTQFAFFIAYGLFSLPAGRLVARLGYGNAIIVALAAMMAGCLCIPLATSIESYEIVLLALFVIASGMTLLQVAANPLVARLGSAEQSHFRLTLSQAFNSLGTVLGPWLGATLMLRGGLFTGHAGAAVGRGETLGNVDLAYFSMALMLALLMAFIWLIRGRLGDAGTTARAPSGIGAALRSRWALAGAAAIFAYVGAEVSIASVMINFLHEPDVLGVSLARAGALLGFIYWGGAMVGRFAGSLLLMRFSPPRLLAGAAIVAAILCFTVLQGRGSVAAVAALSIGLFNSIMFPVIFTVTLERSTAAPEETSGLLCMAIIGGALLPPLVGRIADSAGLHVAFVIPLIAYGLIGWFAWSAARVRLKLEARPLQ